MIQPEMENEGVGFKYTITEEQFRKHSQLSTEEVFRWLEEMAYFFHETQTEEEKMRKYVFKPAKLQSHHPTPEQQAYFTELQKQIDERRIQTPELG